MDCYELWSMHADNAINDMQLAIRNIQEMTSDITCSLTSLILICNQLRNVPAEDYDEDSNDEMSLKAKEFQTAFKYDANRLESAIRLAHDQLSSVTRDLHDRVLNAG